ncbi:MAG: hypothetical protein HKN07_11475 [Acidimicrobiia bacterium]|nr:hypothetical protein [Acidimicrobiia bacterium]
MSKISHWVEQRPALIASAVVLLISLGVVAAAAWISQEANHREFDRQVELDASAFAGALEQGVAEIEATMAGVSGLFVATDGVELLEYRRYIDHIELPEGLLGIAYSPIVTAQQLPEFEQDMGRLIPGYMVWDWSPDGPVEAASHDVYLPVQFFEPIGAQRSSYGLNATSPPGRSALIEKVMASGQDAASPLLPLAISGEVGTLIYRPVVRSNSETIGILTAPIERDALVLASVSEALRQRVDWTIEDVTDAPVVETDAPGAPDSHSHVALRNVEVADRIWGVSVANASGVEVGVSARVYTIIAVGLLIAGLLAAGTHQIVSRRQTQRRLEEVEGLLTAKESFIASVSHELRTPLTGVLGFAETLRDWSDSMSADERDELVGTIASEAGELSNIVEDLIVMARADYGTLAVAAVPVNLRAQCAQVLEMVNEGQRIAIDGGTEVMRASADPARVRQIIRNLVTNADSYGGDRVRIEITSQDDWVSIAVVDNGSGVPVGFEETIFQPYQRAHEKSGKAASIGLGLSISRKLARAMYGDLTYGRVDQETHFVLQLPRLHEEQVAA